MCQYLAPNNKYFLNFSKFLVISIIYRHCIPIKHQENNPDDDDFSDFLCHKYVFIK